MQKSIFTYIKKSLERFFGVGGRGGTKSRKQYLSVASNLLEILHLRSYFPAVCDETRNRSWTSTSSTYCYFFLPFFAKRHRRPHIYLIKQIPPSNKCRTESALEKLCHLGYIHRSKPCRIGHHVVLDSYLSTTMCSDITLKEGLRMNRLLSAMHTTGV